MPAPAALKVIAAPTRTIRITLEFDGTRYAGWQSQPDRTSVQQVVETAVSRVTGVRTAVCGCSRTDAGVSARGYVASFRTASTLPVERLRMAINSHLPKEVLVRAVAEVSAGFHARFSARSKTYVYRIVTGFSPLRRNRAWELLTPLDHARMRRAARLFIGTHDFRPFCQTRDRNGTCTLSRITIAAGGDETTVAICGDRFLYKLVRRIVGALVACGSGRLDLADIRAALAGDPGRRFTTAPACGLILDSVDY